MNDTPLEIVIPPQTPSPSHSVIWLHGLGADGNDFAEPVTMLQFPARFVLPHAPVMPITINGGAKMRGWFDILEADFERAVDVPGITRSCEMLETLVERENQRGVATKNIFLAGFSQGGVIALHTGIRSPQKFAGIIALSTYLPTPPNLPALPNGTPIFFAHGDNDPMIPIDLAKRSVRQLSQLGFPVVWNEYPMAHSLCPDEFVDIAEFLQAHSAAV